MRPEDFIQIIATEAGEIVRNGYRTLRTWRAKTDPGDVVTEIDIASEKHVIDRITRQYPDDGILSEESGACVQGTSGTVWIIDPLDGTRNYTLQIPFFCVSIARAVNGVVETGVIYDPVHDEMFYAARGRGSYVNGERVSVSPDGTVEDALINVSWASRTMDARRFLDCLEHLSGQTSYFRRFGSAALVMAYVGCGRMHGYVQGGVNPWDVAAGIVIVEEAGGIVTDFRGNQIELGRKKIEVVAANPNIHRCLLEVIDRAQRA